MPRERAAPGLGHPAAPPAPPVALPLEAWVEAPPLVADPLFPPLPAVLVAVPVLAPLAEAVPE